MAVREKRVDMPYESRLRLKVVNDDEHCMGRMTRFVLGDGSELKGVVSAEIVGIKNDSLVLARLEVYVQLDLEAEAEVEYLVTQDGSKFQRVRDFSVEPAYLKGGHLAED